MLLFFCPSVYLSVCLANFNCSGDYTNCGGSSPDQLCIYQDDVCDKENDCGNNWDELPETCGQFTSLIYCLSTPYMYIIYNINCKQFIKCCISDI